MVKLLTYCLLLSSLLVGCSAGIVDPPPVEPTNASGYFWPSDIDSATYSQKTVLGGSRTSFTLNFEHTSTTFAQVSDNSGNDQFTYRITDEGIYLDNLTKVKPFFPLPEGFSLDTIVTTVTTTFRKMKKVLVVNENSLLAVDLSDSMYLTTDLGATWTNVYWAYGALSTWTYSKGSIYAGTHDGMICISANMGKSWEVISTSAGRSAITAIVVADSPKYLYYATNDSVLALLNNSKDPVLAASENLGSVTSLAITGNIQVGYILSASTESNGIWTAEVAPDTAKPWKQATTLDWTNCYELVAINVQTLYALANIGGQVKLITSTDRGFKWTTANTGAPEGGPSFLAFTEQSLLAVSKKGITTSYNTKNIIRALQPAINATEVSDLSGGGGVFAVATDSGIFMFNTNLKWQNVSLGLSEKTRHDAHVKGSLLLLKAGENSLDPGNTWDAGTCHGVIGGATSTYFITAKVSEAINEFSLATLGGNKYTDVLPVQYIFSKAANSTNVGLDTYRLIIYYAKGVGPVYFQNYLGQVLLSEMYRN